MILELYAPESAAWQETNLLEQLQLSFPFTLNNVSPLDFLFFPILQQWNSDFPIFLRNVSNSNECLCQDTLILFTVTVTLPLYPEHNLRGRGPCCYHAPASRPLLLRRCWHATGPELQRMWWAAGRHLSTATRCSWGLPGLWKHFQSEQGSKTILQTLESNWEGKRHPHPLTRIVSDINKSQCLDLRWLSSLNNQIILVFPFSHFHNYSKISLLKKTCLVTGYKEDFKIVLWFLSKILVLLYNGNLIQKR